MERKSIFYADLFVRSGEKDTRHDKNHRSGSAARQGGHQPPDECSRWPGYR